MSAKFQNKYRIDSSRLQHWNYGWECAYFITICAKGREGFFGNVVDGAMQLNKIGEKIDFFNVGFLSVAAAFSMAEFCS